ncbi:unnamed protein product [Hyaloperonospora brassicae]|uniref:Expansin-like EG45 domain-containing protein n=1 Tax=Hyaloperonospora brassicae TaxID=162125 RepID=A0AAV0U378_HYABA|nr:unnamed protein product [Hyaloperonospora brassicae]
MDSPSVGDYYAAINRQQWHASRNCGRCAEVSGDDPTVAATVYIVDECPKCKAGGLGLAPAVLKQLRSERSQRSGIRWRFVDCPVRGHVKFCANSRSTRSWVALQPVNAVAGVTKVAIAGHETVMLDSGFFFVLNESSVDLSNVTVALTSTAGETITDSLSLTPGKCTPGTSNFGPSRRVKVLNNFDELTYDSDYKAGDVMAMDEEALAPPARPAATTSDAHLLLVAPVVLAAVCAVAWGAFAYVARRAKATPTDESNSLTSPFSTRSSPAILSDTMTRL